MMRTKPIQTTKWGTACAQCAAAKAKCSGRSGTQGSKCDRCERLLKQCTDQVHKPRKTRQSRQSQQTDTGSPSFDSMVSTPEHPSSPSAAELGLETSSVGSHLSGPHDRPFLLRTSSSHSQHHVDGSLVGIPEPYSTNPFFATPTPLGRPRDMVFEGREDADELLLSKYRTELMPQHPFVIVPHHIQAAALKAHHPFLMLAIRVVASFEDLRTTHARMHQISAYIADRMFRQAERSLDLLMGIVVILGWHHYHCVKHSQLNNLLCLAESLVSDLGLNKRSPDGESGVDGRPIEEKRLLLGVWYLRSSAAMHLQQLTSMPFTSYMRQCLVEIPEAKDHDLDQALIHFVKIQYLAERVAVLKTPQPKRTDTGNERMALEGNEQDKEGEERGAALAGCQAYLDRLVRELPTNLKEDAMIVTQFNTVALRLSEPRGSDVVHPRAGAASRLSFSSDSPTIETLLKSATAAIRGWFQSWISGVPASSYRALPSHAILQLLYAVGAVIRGSSSDQASPQGRSYQGHEGSTAGSSVSSGQSGLNAIEDAVAVLNRLIALGATGPDTDKFWAALGEAYDDECAQAGGHYPAADDLSESSEDVLNAVMSAGTQRNPRRGNTRGDVHALTSSLSNLSSSSGYPPSLERQTSQTLYQNMFIPPSRVPSVGPGQREYVEASLIPPVLPAGTQLPQTHPNQWTAAQPWDAGASSWTTPEGMDPQMWMREAGQGNPPYGWGSDRRY